MNKSITLGAVLIGLVAAPVLGEARELTRTTCHGEFGTGSGMAGSYVGDHCLLKADTAEESMVQGVCEQGAQCSVMGLAERRTGKWVLRKVISANR